MANKVNNTSDLTTREKQILFNQVRTLVGGGLLSLEIPDEVLDTLLDVCVTDLSGMVNSWAIEQSWANFQGEPIDTADIANYLTMKTLNFEKSFTFAYSKQVGMGTNSQWELKKGNFVISSHTQTYNIGKNKEVNELLWVTPPPLSNFGFGDIANLSPVGWSAGPFGWGLNGQNAYAILPSSSMYIYSQDIKTKTQILQSDLTYRITSGPENSKVIHLYPIPGSKDEVASPWGKHLPGSLVWYWYYDVKKKSREQCLLENPELVSLPSDIQVRSLRWSTMNEPTRVYARRLLVSKTKNWLGMTRGKFSGKILGLTEGQDLQMDYEFLLEQSVEEEKKVFEDLEKFLDKISNKQLMEDRASIATNLNTVMSFQPPPQLFYTDV